jgi:hypothetical protein
MPPFGVTPADVLDHHALGYQYDTEETTNPEPVDSSAGTGVVNGMPPAG